MNFNFETSIITTNPDGNEIELFKISRQEFNKLVSNYKPLENSQLDFSQAPTFISPNGYILYEVTIFKYALLFKNLQNHCHFIKGEIFFDSSIGFDKENHGHLCFSIKPAQTTDLLKKKHIIESKYNSEGYVAYFFVDKSVCYFINRAKDFKQGFWFSNEDSFMFFFENIF